MDFAPHLAAVFAAVGDLATWTPAGGQSAGVRGAFRAPYAVGAGGMVGGAEPMFETSLPTSIAVGDAIAVAGRSYRVAVRKDDVGMGVTALILEEA